MDLRHLCLLFIGKATAKHRTYVRHYVCLLLINKANAKYKTLYILDTYSPHTRHMECVLFFNSFPWFLILFLTGGGKSPMYCSEFHKWKIQFHTNYPWVYSTTVQYGILFSTGPRNFSNWKTFFILVFFFKKKSSVRARALHDFQFSIR